MPFPAYNLSLDETVALSPLSKKNEVMSVRNIGGHCEIPSFSSTKPAIKHFKWVGYTNGIDNILVANLIFFYNL